MPALLLPLLAAHVIGDFLLQSTALVQRKAQLRPLAYLEHGFVHAALAWLLVMQWPEWRLPLLVFVVHLAIDLTKELARGVLRRRDLLDAQRQLTLFSLDQIAHVLALIAIAAVHARDVQPMAALAGTSWYEPARHALIFVTGWVVTVRTGSIVIGLAVARYQPDLREAAASRNDPVLAIESRGLEGGGQMIGALERTLAFLFVLLEVYAGIGFLLAAKSILRFGDANDPKNRRQAEYIIIGTLMSFTWALVVASLTRMVLAI